MSYEVWEKSKLATRKALADKTCMTLDVAMDTAVKLSKGTKKASVWNPKKKDASGAVIKSMYGGTGGMEEVDVPNAYAVVDRDDKQSRVRGWGIGGKWYDAKICKRCDNSGQDPTSWQEPCSACRGASYTPKL